MDVARWLLQGLAAEGHGCELRVSDVLVLDNGEVCERIWSNQAGRVCSAKCEAFAREDWDKFVRACRRVAAVGREDSETPVAIRYSALVDGMQGVHVSTRQLLDLAKGDAMARNHVVGIQAIVAPRCATRARRGPRPTIVYKTELLRGPGHGFRFADTKEYSLGPTKIDTHMSTTDGAAAPSFRDLQAAGGGAKDRAARPEGEATSPRAGAGAGAPLGRAPSASGSGEARASRAAPVAERGQVGKETLRDHGTQRAALRALALRAVRAAERAHGVAMGAARLHWAIDDRGVPWLVGASRIALAPGPGGAESAASGEGAAPAEAARLARRLQSALAREKLVGAGCLAALRKAPEARTPQEVHAIFAELRGNRFLAQLPSAFHRELCRRAEHRRVDRGVEAVFAGDPLDCLLVIVSGAVRAILEPAAGAYHRTIDLSDKDTFGEQAITRPGTPMRMQAMALEDTELLVLPRAAFEEVLRGGAEGLRARFRLTRMQLERCRKVLALPPRERSMVDVQAAAAATVNLAFFQNIPTAVHLVLLRGATRRVAPPGAALFDCPQPLPKEAEDEDDEEGFAPERFLIVLSGVAEWRHRDQSGAEVAATVGPGQHLQEAGAARAVGDAPLELLEVSRAAWERAANDLHDAEAESLRPDSTVGDALLQLGPSLAAAAPAGGATFLTATLEAEGLGDPWAALGSGTGLNPAGHTPVPGPASAGRARGGVPPSSDHGEFSRRRSSAELSRVGGAAPPSVEPGDTFSRHSGDALSPLAAPSREGSTAAHWRGALRRPPGLGQKETNRFLETKRFLTCAVTGQRFPLAQKRTLERRQVRGAALHLRERGATQPGFDREIWLTRKLSFVNLMADVTVCPAAYEVYVAEANLEDQEKLFARAVLDPALPRVAERSLPPGGAPTPGGGLSATQLLVAGMFVEVASVEAPTALLAFGRKFELRFYLCGGPVAMRFEVDPPAGGEHQAGPGDATSQALREVRVAWFLCGDEGVNRYLEAQVERAPPPLPYQLDTSRPSPRTNRTRRVPHPVLIGHTASLTPY